MSRYIAEHRGACQYLTIVSPGHVQIGTTSPRTGPGSPLDASYVRVTRGWFPRTRLTLVGADDTRTVVYGVNRRSQKPDRIGYKAARGIFSMNTGPGAPNPLDAIEFIVQIILFPWTLWLFCSARHQTTILQRALQTGL